MPSSGGAFDQLNWCEILAHALRKQTDPEALANAVDGLTQQGPSRPVNTARAAANTSSHCGIQVRRRHDGPQFP